jgi:hypothetical protein
LRSLAIVIVFFACVLQAQAWIVESESLTDNPIAVPFGTLSHQNGRKVSSCLRISLKLSDAKGAVVAHNDCGTRMAILVDPVETYYRRTKTEFFVPSTIVEPVYATLYIFRADLAMGKNSFIGDGGLEVFGWPKFTLLASHSKVELSLVGRDKKLSNLPPGKYGAILITFAAPTTLEGGGTNSFDLDDDVKNFNRAKFGRVEIPSTAEVVSSPVSYFNVLPPKKH